MEGRELERLAQRNRNWAKTGFSRETPAPPRTVTTVKREEVITDVAKREETPTPVKQAFKGITAINIGGKLYGIRKPYDSDTPADKLNLELLEFMFCAYGRHGVLPLSDLVGFITHGEWSAAGGKRNFMSYLECADSTAAQPIEQNTEEKEQISQEQFDNRLADLIVKGLDFASIKRDIKDLINQADPIGFAPYKSKLLLAWIEANKQALMETIGQ